MPDYKDWKTKRFYETGAHEDPSSWVYLEHPKLADWYSLNAMLDFIDAAKRHEVDPSLYTALGISESGLGNQDYGNPVHIFWNKHPELQKQMEKIPDTQLEKQRQTIIDYGAKYLADQFKRYSGDLLSALQAYSGTGKTIYTGHPDVVKYQLDTTRVFGKPYQKINFWKDKPQANRIVGIANLLRENPELTGLFEPKLSDVLPSNIPKVRQKGPGFWGTLTRPDKGVSTEISIGVPIQGKETEVPTLVPTLTKKEIDYLLGGGTPTQAIVDKAVEHAMKRLNLGLSPFAQSGETAAVPIGQSGMPDLFPSLPFLSDYLK
jgi:hypothetical protein